jgi:hypothetical protein
MNPREVTACLVTRGDQPAMIERIRETLIFDHVVVWDNSEEPNWKTAGRYMAALDTDATSVYFQDDDVVVPPETQQALIDEFFADDEPDVVANYAHGRNDGGYGDLPLVGAGAIVDKRAAWDCIVRYGGRYPLDDAFKYECDFAIGVLYRNWRHVHLPFHINLEVAQDPSRLCNQPWQAALKHRVTERARRIRDEELVVA